MKVDDTYIVSVTSKKDLDLIIKVFIKEKYV